MMNAWQVLDKTMNTKQAGSLLSQAGSLLSLAAVAAVAAALTGCATGGGSTGTEGTGSGTLIAVQGRIMGGQQPVAGATIQLYAPNTSAAMGGATALLTSAVTTDASGNFNISGKYPCPSANPGVNVYLVATGGNPGLPGTVNNTHLALMAALGACSTLPLNYPVIQVNELTTVAAAYALAGFMADTAHTGASANNAMGLSNAFATAQNLVSSASGGSPGTTLPSTSTIPVAEMNTLADIIAACVNTDGTGSPCATLLTQATPSGGTMPADTVGALLAIARHPANNVATLYSLASSKSPYLPTLAAAPNDWTMVVSTTGGGLNAPTGLAIDATGSVWVANSGGTAVTKLSNLQVQTSGAFGYANVGALGPQGIAIDTAGNAWIANSSAGSVLELSTAGVPVSPAGGYKLGGISSPQAIAIDANNNVWVTNFNANTISGLNGATTPVTAISGSPFTAGGTLSLPAGLAIDSSNIVWISSSGNSLVAAISSAGATLSGTGFTDGVLEEPTGVAIDPVGHVFVANNALPTLSIFTGNGSPAQPVTSAGLVQPVAFATDGASALYVSDSTATGAITMIPSFGAVPIKLGAVNTPVGLAVDESGNVWTANSGDNTVSEFIGLATPVRTPLALKFGAF